MSRSAWTISANICEGILPTRGNFESRAVLREMNWHPTRRLCSRHVCLQMQSKPLRERPRSRPANGAISALQNHPFWASSTPASQGLEDDTHLVCNMQHYLESNRL